MNPADPSARFRRFRLVCTAAWRRLCEDRLGLWAASLSIRSLFAIVPFLFVASLLLPLVEGEGFRETMIRWIVSVISLGKAEEIEKALRGFLGQIHFKTAGYIGMGFLILIAIDLVGEMEKALNAVFRIRTRRPLWRRFASFWTVATLGPLCLLASIAFTGWVERFLPSWTPSVGGWLVPIIVSTLGFSVAYAFVPHGGTPMRGAIRGGIVAALVFELVKRGYGIYLTSVVPSDALFGSLAALPLFIWGVYVSWLVFLFGAEVARFRRPSEEIRESLEPSEREVLGLDMMRRIAEAFLSGRGPLYQATLAREMRITAEVLRSLLEPLLARGHILIGADGLCQLARDPGRIPAREILSTLRGPGLSSRDVPESLRAFYARVEAGFHEASGEMTLRDLAEPGGPPSPPSASVSSPSVSPQSVPEGDKQAKDIP